MKEKILELRAQRPIPLMEAKQLLTDNEGDIEKCVLLYTAKAIRMIVEATGTDAATADRHYQAEKYDINLAISMIKEEMYDANYKAIAGVNKDSLSLIKEWIYILETKDFGYSLSYSNLTKAIEVMNLIPELDNVVKMLINAKEDYDRVFEGYNDNMPLDEFVRRNRQLDDCPAFIEANSIIPLQIITIKQIISRHLRNVQNL
ncbi:hypothetical protein [Dysgonomonas massiliensis]|uniref:hypothetical protein n=1 Tax=Dysgonomonas massiliensis TaxID=2040292 RepID=UPI000C77FCD3|nr:hypothetical protein [Dysgonomonas massiliensis]